MEAKCVGEKGGMYGWVRWAPISMRAQTKWKCNGNFIESIWKFSGGWWRMGAKEGQRQREAINFRAHKSCNLLFANANLLTFILWCSYLRHKISSQQFNAQPEVLKLIRIHMIYTYATTEREKLRQKQEIAINFYMHVHNFFIYKSMCINVETEIIKRIRISLSSSAHISYTQTNRIDFDVFRVGFFSNLGRCI